jgi:uncharacterized membrane protein YedE/YeeE
VKERFIAFILKRINWGKLLPTLFKMVAEGKVDKLLGLTAEKGLKSYPIKRAYWLAAGRKTFAGAVLIGVGTGLEAVCANFTGFTWTCGASRWVYLAGGVLTSIGLVDGGTRAPWPEGTPKDPALIAPAQ